MGPLCWYRPPNHAWPTDPGVRWPPNQLRPPKSLRRKPVKPVGLASASEARGGAGRALVGAREGLMGGLGIGVGAGGAGGGALGSLGSEQDAPRTRWLGTDWQRRAGRLSSAAGLLPLVRRRCNRDASPGTLAEVPTAGAASEREAAVGAAEWVKAEGSVPEGEGLAAEALATARGGSGGGLFVWLQGVVVAF